MQKDIQLIMNAVAMELGWIIFLSVFLAILAASLARTFFKWMSEIFREMNGQSEPSGK